MSYNGKTSETGGCKTWERGGSKMWETGGCETWEIGEYKTWEIDEYETWETGEYKTSETGEYDEAGCIIRNDYKSKTYDIRLIVIRLRGKRLLLATQHDRLVVIRLRVETIRFWSGRLLPATQRDRLVIFKIGTQSMLPTTAYYTITRSWERRSFTCGSLRQLIGGDGRMLIARYDAAKRLGSRWHTNWKIDLAAKSTYCCRMTVAAVGVK